MLADPEHYKGITYIRISALPGEQKHKIREHYTSETIVKIIKDNALIISDCIIYSDYVKWYKIYKPAAAISIKRETPIRADFELTEK